MTTRVLTALDPGVEAQVATAVGGVREATIARRCVDLADLLASAEAGLGDVALVSAGLRGLGRDDVARLAASGARPIALVTGEEDEARVRQLGIAGVVRADASVADLEAALTAGGAEWAAELGLLDDAAGAGVPTPHGAPVVPQQPPAPEPVEGRITAVWGPTGAPGRTTIAVNLAAELAAAGASVILVDADTYGASIAQVLALLDEAPGVAAAARAGDLGTLDLPALSRLAPEVLPRLRVLTGIPRPDRWPEIRAASFEEVLRLSKLLAEHVVVDCGFCLEDDEELSYDTRAPRRNATTLITLESAEQVVVVGSGDPVGLQRLVRASQDLGGIPSGRPLVVVNRVRASAVGADPQARIVEALGRFAGMEDLHLVPEDRETLDRLLLQGRVLAEGAPRSPAREAIRALAARVAPERFGQAETPARRRRQR